MGDNSKIEWTDATFNPWVGCTKVSAACDRCYAEGWAKRAGHPELWQGERRRTSHANWHQPIRWNRQAAAAGARKRVFCASLADVFDNQVPEVWRFDLLNLILQTPHLDWMLLTKRPQNIAAMLPSTWLASMPHNIWLGTTVESQEEADRRVPHLLAVPAAVRFLSCEPLLGPIDLTRLPGPDETDLDALRGHINATPEQRAIRPRRWAADRKIDWVIAGGESGPGARPMHPDWARSLRNQCVAAGVAFHFKQWGEWAPLPAIIDAGGSSFHRFEDGKWSLRIGKKRAGRLLDGREWNETPEVRR